MNLIGTVNMSPVILPPPIIITETESELFVKAIARALSTLAKNDLREIYLFQDHAVVISYSGDYQPFIGYTMSYNDPDHRLYISQETYVLTRIAEAIDTQGRDMPGGRVFIEKDCAYIKDFEFKHNVILLLNWQHNDPYQKVMNAYKILQR